MELEKIKVKKSTKMEVSIDHRHLDEFEFTRDLTLYKYDVLELPTGEKFVVVQILPDKLVLFSTDVHQVI